MRASASNLLLLLPALAAALHCDSLLHPQQMLNSQMFGLLKQKDHNIPPECAAQMTAFNFPVETLNVTELHLARKAIYEILRGLLGLFTSNLVQMGWETTAQERFLSALYAQSERIKRCLQEEKTEPRRPYENLNKLKLVRYFQKIRTFLQENSHSPCAEVIVRQEALTCFINLDMWTNLND